MSNRKRAQSNELGDKSDYTSKNSKTANPFKNQRGLPPFIPRSSIEKLEFNIDCAAGEPNPSQFKISQGLLITEVPQYFHPPLDYGDHVLAVNGEDIRDKLHFISLLQECQQFNLPHTITFLVERVKSTNQIDLKTMEKEYANLSDNVIITNDKHGYEYFEGTLVFFPRAAVGISVKAVNRKVYIDSTDNGFNSIGRRIFFIGDVVIAVNNTPCYTVAETGDLLLKSLKKDCIVTVILERAIDPMAILFVRTALNAGKAPQMDPKMQDDIVLLCKEEVNRMIERIQNKTKPPKPILRDKKRKKKYDASTKSQHSASLAVHGHHRDRHVEFLPTSKEMTIGMDLWNPTLLMKVPGLSHNRAVNGVLPQRRKVRQSTPPLTLPPSPTPPRQTG